jgi:hypothetical protein
MSSAAAASQRGENEGGKLPELAAHAGLELCARLLQLGVDLATQFLDISVHVIETLGPFGQRRLPA